MGNFFSSPGILSSTQWITNGRFHAILDFIIKFGGKNYSKNLVKIKFYYSVTFNLNLSFSLIFVSIFKCFLSLYFLSLYIYKVKWGYSDTFFNFQLNFRWRVRIRCLTHFQYGKRKP